MSYSVSSLAATKAEVSADIAAKLSGVLTTQPVHSTDIEQAKAAAASLIDLVEDDPARDLYVSVSGSIWQTDTGIEQLSLNVSLSRQARKE